MPGDTPRGGLLGTLYRRQLRRLRRLLFPRLRTPDPTAEADREQALGALYRLVLGRPIDDAGRAHYLRRMRSEGVTIREIAVLLAESDEFQGRLHRRLKHRIEELTAERLDGFVDVRELLATRNLEELSAAAEQYYLRTLAEADKHHAKPLANIHDATNLLGAFGQLLGGLRLTPGMHVVDFGAGTGWITRSLAQLGCPVTAVDVSPTALTLARELFARLPPIGPCPSPRFLVFDGRRLDLPSASVDRIVCFDALHHVPNPAEVLADMARVLKPDGLAAFCEPGPQHSHGAQSQFEMKNHLVVENDILLPEIRTWAEAAGFTRLEVGVFNTDAHLLSLDEFSDLMAGGTELDKFGDRLRAYLRGHQLFFLHRGDRTTDSRVRSSLKARLQVRLSAQRASARERVRGRATLHNIGTGCWLAGGAGVGGVHLGFHLRSGGNGPVQLDFARFPLPAATAPGESRTMDFELPPLAPGNHIVEFDLVSEGVAWFETNGSATVRLPLEIVAS